MHVWPHLESYGGRLRPCRCEGSVAETTAYRPRMKYADLHRIYHLPFFDLLKQARAVHEEHWTNNEVQLCTLKSS